MKLNIIALIFSLSIKITWSDSSIESTRVVGEASNYDDFVSVTVMGDYLNAAANPWGENPKEIKGKKNTSTMWNGTIRKKFAVMAALLNPNKDMVCSPISALLPIGKLALGASGESYDQLAAAIGVASRNKLIKFFKQLIADLKNMREVVLQLASQIFVSTKAQLKRRYEAKVKWVFGTSVAKLNFGKRDEAARTINKWVYNMTNKLIKELVTPDMFSGDTELVLVNAIYFLGKWKTSFAPATKAPFHSPHSEIAVDMMSQKGDYKYMKSKKIGAQIIEIPYVGDNASFIVVSPVVRTGLESMLRRLSQRPKLLAEALDKMTVSNVNLQLPKFKIETTLSLTHLYREMGIIDIFEPSVSKLDKMTSRNIYVTDAVQKTIIEVTEEGTEAAAGTAVIAGISAAPNPYTIHMTVDRPFYYLVKAANHQLFSGICTFQNRDK